MKNEGFPIWKNAKFSYKTNANLPNRENVEGSDTLVTLPVVLENSVYVKDILKVKLNDTILYCLFKGEDYALNGFDHDPTRVKYNADDVVNLIMRFEMEILGSKYYNISDNRLFNKWPTGIVKPNSFLAKLDIIEMDPDGECTLWIETVSTDGGLTWTDTGNEWWEGNCDDGGYIGGGGNDGGGIYTTSPDGGEAPPTIPDGGGGGSNGGSNTPPSPNTPPNTIPPCGRNFVSLIFDLYNQTWKNPCTNVPFPIPPDPTTSTPDPTPCDKVAFLKNTPFIPIIFNELLADATNPSTNFESGYRFAESAPYSPKEVGPPFTLGNLQAVDCPLNFMWGWIHTHPTTTTLPMFSPDDLLVAWHILDAENSTGVHFANSNTFTLGLITHTGDTYIITIQDIDNFNNFINNTVNPTPDFTKNYEAYIHVGQTPAQAEKGFLQLLKRFNTGISLLKAGPGFTTYSELKLNNNNTVTPKPCL